MKPEKITVQYFPQVIDLLKQNGLPHDDLNPNTHVIVGVFDGKTLSGVMGLELYPPYALLRSAAVSLNTQNRGIGSRLVKEVIAVSKKLDLSKLYLLTETAEAFFAKHDFSQLPRENVPDSIKSSKEFQHLCPASAVCMTLEL